MQLPQAVTGWRAADRLPGGPPGSPAYYGFGLFIDEDPVLGRVVSHSGGYPGFGSNMRWHPATGLAVIALGNATYARMNAVAELVLAAVLPPASGYQVALGPGASDSASARQAGEPWPETLAAQESASLLLAGWDDAAADALFCENVALDQPYRERVADLALLRERIGDFAPDPSRPARSDTPAHRRWWLTGERGTVAVSIQLNPQRPPRVQSLGIALPPAAGSPLAQTLAALVAWLNDGTPCGLARDGHRRRVSRRRPDRQAAADGRRLGRPGDSRSLPGRRRQLVGHGRAVRRARDSDPRDPRRPPHRPAPPG